LERFNGNSRATRTALDSNIAFDVLENVREAPETDVSGWSSLSISEDVLSSIASLGFATPTPIQASAIPKILQGHDVIGKAVTGSGKTLAYGIPIFDHWLQAHREGHTTSKSGSNTPTALILAPTRELAHQLAMHISDLTRACANRPMLAKVTGGLSIQKQLRQLAAANFVVGTPGRLWEVMNESQELVNGLKQIKFLVLDEADRLLSDGHFKEIEEILDALDRKIIDAEDATTEQQTQEIQSIRQTLVFSATFHQALQQKLISKSKVTRDDQLKNRHSMEYLLKKLSFREKRPIFIDVNPSVQMAAALDEAILECGAMEKDLYLYYLLLKIPRTRVLVFSNSISSVKRLVSLLQNLKLSAVALHSSMPQKARLRSLERFTTQPTILVATDVAARGLDIKNIELILHYHVPRTADIYVHRSGRTARADKSGKSVMLCSPDEFAGVTRLIGKVHSSYQLDSIQADRTILARLRPRLELSQKLTDAKLAKEKAGTRDQWLRTAAEELGVDYDSDEFAAEAAKSSRGRGAGNSKKEKTAGAISKGDITKMQERLNDLLDQKVNLGVSPRYLAGGNVNVDALLDSQSDSTFLARVSSM
jgi:ATP-dependent RNA helicase DDX24/MAK5